MNKRLIARSFPLIAACLLPFLTANAQIGKLLDPKGQDKNSAPADEISDSKGSDDSVTMFHTALGEASAQGILLSYMSINTLGDAFVAKAYDKNVAKQIAETYGRLVQSQLQGIKRLKTHKSFTKGDQEYFSGSESIFTLLAEQVEHLVEFIESEDEASGKSFEETRVKAKTQINKLLGTDL